MRHTKAELMQSLRSETCPTCGGPKGAMRTLCLACFRKLPHTIKNRLYSRFGEGYETAFQDAMRFLKVTEIKPPARVVPQAGLFAAGGSSAGSGSRGSALTADISPGPRAARRSARG